MPLFDNLVPDREKRPGDEVAHSIIPGNPEYPPPSEGVGEGGYSGFPGLGSLL